MTDSQLILSAIESMNKSHDKCICALREEMAIIQRASTAQVSAEMEVVNMRITSLDGKVSIQNGAVASLKTESLNREQAVKDFRKLEGTIKKVRAKWLLLLLGGILFVVIVTLIYDLGGFPKMFEWLINKIF